VEENGHCLVLGTVRYCRSFSLEDWGMSRRTCQLIAQVRFELATSRMQIRSVTAWVNLCEHVMWNNHGDVMFCITKWLYIAKQNSMLHCILKPTRAAKFYNYNNMNLTFPVYTESFWRIRSLDSHTIDMLARNLAMTSWERVRSSVRLDSSKKVGLEVNAGLVAGCTLLNDTISIWDDSKNIKKKS
jgi:hypothetical protein